MTFFTSTDNTKAIVILEDNGKPVGFDLYELDPSKTKGLPKFEKHLATFEIGQYDINSLALMFGMNTTEKKGNAKEMMSWNKRFSQ